VILVIKNAHLHEMLAHRAIEMRNVRINARILYALKLNSSALSNKKARKIPSLFYFSLIF
jgi:hypothetical protein